jgi:hypothetical protein
MALWSKGKSGNPKGRPKKGVAIAELARLQIEKYKLIEKLASIGAGQNDRDSVDVDQQLRAIQLLLAYGYGPPRVENEATGGLKIEVIYAETNHIAIAGAPPGAAARDPASQAVQCRLLRAPLGQDGIGDGSADSSGPAG